MISASRSAADKVVDPLSKMRGCLFVTPRVLLANRRVTADKTAIVITTVGPHAARDVTPHTPTTASSFLTWRRRLRVGTNHTTRPTSSVLSSCAKADPANSAFLTHAEAARMATQH